MNRWIYVALLALLAMGCQQDDPQPAAQAEPQPAPQADAQASDPQEVEVETTPDTDAASGPDLGERLSAAAAGEHRSEGNRARNEFRHPVETLTFFGLEEDMTVIEIWPGGGWYTEILAPALRDTGKVVVAAYDPEVPDQPEYTYRLATALAAKFEADPQLYDQVETVGYSLPGEQAMGPANSADLVLTFRNAHGWMRSGIAATVMADAFSVLRPGGVLGFVQHRADDGSDPAETAPMGYVSEEAVIALATAAGFELADRSEINANPMDTKDYEQGVWTLPPSLRLGDEDREKYEAIGESDRMTLKFVKPVDPEAIAEDGYE